MCICVCVYLYLFVCFTYSDEGNIGKFELKGNTIHEIDFKLDSHLNLNLKRDDENGIVWRGVKVR